jgi:hypothetical protein
MRYSFAASNILIKRFQAGFFSRNPLDITPPLIQ